METLNRDTKKAQTLKWRYLSAPSRNIDDCYAKPSNEKRRVWRQWLERCLSMGGSDIKIIAYNCQTFTLGFTYPNPNTGVLQVAYITPAHDYEIEM